MAEKIYYDIGINNENGNVTIRFSVDGVNYAYIEFGTLKEFELFVEKVNGVLGFLKSIP